MKLICPIEPFDMLQTVFVAYDDGTVVNVPAKMNLTNLVDFIPQYCYSNNINNVTFVGVKDYINTMLKDPIEYLITSEYASMPKIEIEVI